MGKKIELSRKTITEDKDGNALVTGKFAVENSPVDAKDLTNKEYVDNAIAQAAIGGEIDTSGFALKTELPTKTSQLTNDSGFMTSIPDEYVTNSELEQTLIPYGQELDKKSNIINYSDHTLNGVETYNNLEKLNTSETSGPEALYIIDKSINLTKGSICSIEVKFSDNTNLLLQGEVVSNVLEQKEVNSIQIMGQTPVGIMLIDKAKYSIGDNNTASIQHNDNASTLVVLHPKANNVISLIITKPTTFEINNSFFMDYQFVNDTEKENWNNKADKSELFSGDYNDLTNKPCYDTREIEIKEYTYDGTGTPFENTIKVSNDVFTLEDIRKGMNFKIECTLFSDNSSQKINMIKVDESDATLECVTDDNGVYAVNITNYILIFLRDADGYTTGVYLTHDSNKYISYFSFEKVISGDFKPLDEAFLTNKPGKIVKVPCDCGDEDCNLVYTGEIFNDTNGNKAGKYSHAEGLDTWALGDVSHAEGSSTKAMGSYSHAEGCYTEAMGSYSHAEGCGCVTNAESAHAEGFGTIANGNSQHAQGKYNIPDDNNKFAHIVGNGSSDTNRKNAHTLDWNGNAWFAGKATVSVQPTDNNDLTTKKYVDDIAANKVDVVEGKALVNTGEIARLSKVDNYNDAEVRGLIEDLSESKADATSIPTKVSQLTNDSGFLTAVPATYATQAYVADAINKAQLDGSDSEIDLSPYALTSDLALKADKTELHIHENQTLLNSITEEHLISMAEISDTLNGPRNYYNAEAITDGVYLNSNGHIYENSIYFTTDYIPIAPGQTLYFYGANGRYDVQVNARFVGFFDTGRNFIAGSVVSYVNQITNTHETGAYIRITVQHGGWGLGYVENVYPGVDIKYGEIPESKLWEKPQKIDVFLPDNIYCAVGTTIELYNNQVCLQADKLHLNWCCDYGHAMKRKFSFEGTSALAGQIIPVTLEIYNDYNVLKYTKTIQIHVVAATITNSITCVPIGDSWTNQKPWPGEVINLSGEKVSFVGKFTARVKDANGNWREYNHEGRSGFSAYDYDGAHAYTFGNAGEDTHHAFYNPTTARFDWNNYVNTVLGGTQPGAVILQMGINGVAADNTKMVGHEVNMINLIRQDNADIPIFVTLPAYKGNQDGLGVQESSDGHAYHRGVYDYLEKQKVMNYCSLLYESCKDMVGVYFIPLNICFDSEYNYGAQEVPVNPRATSIIEKIPMEAVHPQDYGYYQMADIVYSVMCGNLS